jgi:hypothetical protein
MPGWAREDFQPSWTIRNFRGRFSTATRKISNGSAALSGAALGVTFADQFGVQETWMQSKGIFNPTLDVDSPLFIDPFLLAYSKQAEFSDCAFTAYEEHFATLHRLLVGSEEVGDKAWLAALRKFRFSEAQGMGGTCLGYSQSTSGRAFGPVKSRRAISWASGVIRLGVKDPELFSSMSLFEKGIGPDLISDMVTSISIDCILSFNDRILNLIKDDLGIDIPLHPFTLKGRKVSLPRNPFSAAPVILLADDILKHLPLMDDPRGLAGIAEHNEDLRDRVNEHIGEIFKIRTKQEKDRVTAMAMQNAASFQAFLDLLKIMEKEPYNLYKDPQGLVQWSHIARDMAAINKLELKDNTKLSRLERVEAVVVAIIEQFTKLIEKDRMWRVFYVDEQPRHERFAQLLFQALAKAYCAANGLDISPESDGGAGPVDFKFSDGDDRVLVEIKLSSNSSVVSGYEKQLEAYMEAEDAALGHYVLIDVGKMGNKWNRLQGIAGAHPQFSKRKRIHLIDGHFRPSASNLK